MKAAWIAVCFCLALPLLAQPQDAPLTADEIIQRSVQANDEDWRAEPRFSYTEHVRDSDGNRTYEVSIIDGSPYKRLLAVNGQPLSPDQQAEEQRKMEEAIEKRKNQSADERASRIAKYNKDRKRDHEMMEQLTKAFSFTLEGEQQFNGFQVYVLRATPKPGYQPPNMETQVLTGMRGTMWIDTQTFQWVKVAAEVVQPVSIEGFLARVMPGTRFELEKTPVESGVWLPKRFSMTSRARVLGLFRHNDAEEDVFTDYRKQAAPDVNARK